MPECNGKMSNRCKSLVTLQGQNQKSEGQSQIKWLSVGLNYILNYISDQ
jgi:hypothetical protein